MNDEHIEDSLSRQGWKKKTTHNDYASNNCSTENSMSIVREQHVLGERKKILLLRLERCCFAPERIAFMFLCSTPGPRTKSVLLVADFQTGAEA